VDIPAPITYNLDVEAGNRDVETGNQDAETGRSTRGRMLLATVVALLLAIVVAQRATAGDTIELSLGTAASDALRHVPEPEPIAPVAREARLQAAPNPASGLPVPEPVPLDPYAPTPEIRHGTLEIPAIGLSQPLFEGVTLTAINRGPSHWPGTAMPGERGNVVVAGHRTTYSRPFWDIHLLEPGDQMVFTTDEGRFVYELTSTEVVTPESLDIVDQHPGHTATLFACHPRGSARERIVGNFELVDPAPTRSALTSATD
jgi:LPXTG-site transpeptidase (sortase) family protein